MQPAGVPKHSLYLYLKRGRAAVKVSTGVLVQSPDGLSRTLVRMERDPGRLRAAGSRGLGPRRSGLCAPGGSRQHSASCPALQPLAPQLEVLGAVSRSLLHPLYVAFPLQGAKDDGLVRPSCQSVPPVRRWVAMPSGFQHSNAAFPWQFR